MHFSSSLSLSASDLDLGRTLLPLLLPRGKRRRPRRGGRRTGGRRRRPQRGRTRAQWQEAAPLAWRTMPPVVGSRAQQRGRAGPVLPQLAVDLNGAGLLPAVPTRILTTTTGCEQARWWAKIRSHWRFFYFSWNYLHGWAHRPPLLILFSQSDISAASVNLD